MAAKDGWNEWSQYVLKALERLNSWLNELDNKIASIKEEIIKIKQQITGIDEKTTIVNKKVEEKIIKDLDELTTKVKKILDCIERRKQERAQEKAKGFTGYFLSGWVGFRERSSTIVVGSLIVGGFWFFIWMLTKSAVFKESPWGLLKFFGIGG